VSTSGSPVVHGLSILALVALAVGSRAWFLSGRLHGWDPVQHALGLDQFSVFLHRPHPPGAPTYHGLLRAVHLLVPDLTLTVLWVGVALAVCAVLAAWVFARELAPISGAARPGLAALLVLVSPGLWSDGVAGGSAGGDAALAALVGLFCLRTIKRGALRDVVLGSLVLGVLIGFRQNVNLASLAMVPLWLWSLWRLPVGRRLAGVGVLAAACAAWAIPTALATGGWSAWLGPTVEHWRTANTQSLVVAGSTPGAVIALVKGMVKLAIEYIGLASIPVAAALVLVIASGAWRRSLALAFTLWWLLPMAAAALVAPYHVDEYYAVALPVVCWWGVVGMVLLSDLVGRAIPRLRLARGFPVGLLGSAVCLASTATVVVGNGALFLGHQMKSVDFQAERYYAILDRVAEDFDPSTTMILSSGLGQRYACLYLPGYVSLYLPVVEGGDWPFAGRISIDGAEEILTEPSGAVPDYGRTIRTLVITEPFHPVVCSSSLGIEDRKGMFRLAQTPTGEIVVHYDAAAYRVDLAGAEPVCGCSGGEDGNEPQQ